MTRTRTQTALTKLAMLIANVHGELALVDTLLVEARAVLAQAAGVVASEVGPLQESGAMPRQKASAIARACARAKAAETQVSALECRRVELLELRESLYATVRQFDPGLDPTNIGSDDGWLRKFGRGGGKAAVRRYLAAIAVQTPPV